MRWVSSVHMCVCVSSVQVCARACTHACVVCVRGEQVRVCVCVSMCVCARVCV